MSELFAIGNAVPKSIGGTQLGHRTIDSLMSSAVENRSLRRLEKWSADSWQDMTLMELADKLSQHIPIHVHEAEIATLGIRLDTTTSNPPPSTLLHRIDLVLRDFDLGIQLEGEIILLTSTDYLDSNPMIRVYDVGPIVLSPPFVTHRRNWSAAPDYDSLTNTLIQHVEPESWLAAGGQSSITPLQAGSRHFLTVSAPMKTQLQVTALLDTIVKSADHKATSNHNARTPPSASLPRPYLDLPAGIR